MDASDAFSVVWNDSTQSRLTVKIWNKEVNSVQFKPAEETETCIVVIRLCGLKRQSERERVKERHPEPPLLLVSAASVRLELFLWNKQPGVQMGWSSCLLHFTTDPCVRMTSNSKTVNSAAIKAEIKRHDSLQTAINRLAKQFERVGDQQLRSGLKVYLHSIQGKLLFLKLGCSLWLTFTCKLQKLLSQ